MSLAGIVALLAAVGVDPAAAQAPPDPATVDPASLTLPDLAFKATPDDEKNFDKYFFFHRDGTDFATAFADLRECDGYAQGISYRYDSGPVPYPYAGTLGGAIGGAIGSALADAIYGSAARRKQRREIMRTCMGYKGYGVFGLPKAVWETFNFEEGNSHVEEPRRSHLLAMQAKAAIGPRPVAGEIAQ